MGSCYVYLETDGYYRAAGSEMWLCELDLSGGFADFSTLIKNRFPVNAVRFFGSVFTFVLLTLSFEEINQNR